MVAAAPSESGTVLSGKDGSSETASSEETSIHPRGKRTESNGAGDNDGATITGMSAHGSSYLTDHHRRSSAAQATPVTFSQLVRHSRSIDEERDASRMERYFWRIANLVCILPLYLRFHWFKEQRVSIILEFFACYVHLWLLPMQAGFEWAQRPATYAFAYVLDVIILFARVRELVIKMRNFHSSRVSRRKQHRYVLELVKVGIVFPYDAFMMMHGEMPVSTISEIRLMKMLWMLPQLHQCMVFLERSQSVPFFFARLARVLHIFFLNTHWLCCIFRWLSTDDNAKHYATARWTGDGDAPINQYMRATYWSMMTLTTTGHVDIINEDGTEAGAHWETIWAILVVILATFVYIYVNANFTSLILRLNTQLETYRTRLQGVDSYLQRNKVSRELRRAVKRHFTHTFTQGADADQSLIEQMPHALRRAVLAAEQAPEEERIQLQRQRLEVSSRLDDLRQRWQEERTQLEELGQLLQQDEDLRHAIAEAERQGDLEEAARLQYDQLHTVQQRRESLEASQSEAQASGTALLREQVEAVTTTSIRATAVRSDLAAVAASAAMAVAAAATHLPRVRSPTSPPLRATS